MATFRVGQRVRLVAHRFPNGKVTIGTIGQVSGAGPWETGDWFGGRQFSSAADYLVYFSGAGDFAVLAYQIVPATDCYDKAEWKECPWVPPHLRTGEPA